MVVLHPCVGGPVDTALFPHAPDIARGKLDVYGQLSKDYALQYTPHMWGIASMVRRTLGASDAGDNVVGAGEDEARVAMPAATAREHGADVFDIVDTLPTLKIVCVRCTLLE